MSFDDDFEVYVNDVSDDYLLALSLQSLEEELNSEENKSYVKNDYELALSLSQTNDKTNSDLFKEMPSISGKDVVSPQLELTDPNPNIWHLMKTFDDLFFRGVLGKHCIELKWSSRMTRTAGLCGWSPTTNYCFINLSLPLLQLRSRKDLVETLLHEMIHALLFVTREDDNHESHGRVFHEHMYRINSESGANITVYHNFHDEVNYFLKHIWRCNGVCQSRSPYFGYVKRAMNRSPGPHDYWFKFHQMSCGGTFIKISEPKKETKESKCKVKEVLSSQHLKNKDIRSYLSPNKSQTQNTSQIIPFSGIKLESNESKNKSTKSDKNVKTFSKDNKTIERNNFFKAFKGKGYVLGGKTDSNNSRLLSQTKETKHSSKKSFVNKGIEVIEID